LNANLKCLAEIATNAKFDDLIRQEEVLTKIIAILYIPEYSRKAKYWSILVSFFNKSPTLLVFKQVVFSS
jgi:hypothetical protein